MESEDWATLWLLATIALSIFGFVKHREVASWRDRAKKVQDADSYYSEKIRAIETGQAKVDREAAHLKDVIANTARTYPWVAKLHGDLVAADADNLAARLKRKSRPAFKAAEQVQMLKQSWREQLQQTKYAAYKATIYESVFPFLTDLVETAPTSELAAPGVPLSESDDPVRQYLSAKEYEALTPAKKNQLALARYIERRKSAWEIGRDYERYVGYRYEQLGYVVEYHGAVRGLEDLGRDLIARRQGETLIIQCKYWSRWKDIHENAVFQLFGSTIDYAFESKLLRDGENALEAIARHGVKPVFVTSTTMSERAQVACRALSIEARTGERFDADYPRIKCNVGANGRIYHLPFDQQYDRIRIDPDKGEFYASTTAQAEAKGFRRAFKWRPSKSG